MTITREQGYAIEGGPEPKPAEDSPERLRERREALGKDDAWIEHILSALDVGVGAHKGDGGNGRNRRMVAEGDPDGCDSSYDSDEMEEIRAAYAAALSAEEERRGAQLLADEEARAEAFHAEPERPAPRFKVGDCVRMTRSDDDKGFVVTRVHWLGDGGVMERMLMAVPTSPPAPEVVDVPQPVVKRMGDHTAAWERGESEVSIATKMAAGPDRVMGYPLALLRAMLEAIDAQQGGAS